MDALHQHLDETLHDHATPDRARIIAVTEPRTKAEQQALDAALVERTRAERYEIAMRRAHLHLCRSEISLAAKELENALLSTQ